jgi:tetratricopeptide (TPR) repeat protein
MKGGTMQMKLALRVTVAALACVVVAAPSLASDSGSRGGGTSSPSMSTPDFDAATEYRDGIESLKAQKFAEAKKSFARVLGVAPTDANTNFLAGMADAGLNDLKSAAKHYEKAVKADGKLIAAQQELGVTYAKLGDKAKAEATLDKLQKLNTACAGTCKDADNLKQAIDAVQAALAQPGQAMLQTDPPLLFASAKAGDAAYLDAVALINQHRYGDAIAALQRARTTFGAHPDILTYLGFANRKLHHYDVAESYYRQALAVDPTHLGATEYYGELMVERGNVTGAKAMLAKLDKWCTFGCAQADELRRWIDERGRPAS